MDSLIKKCLKPTPKSHLIFNKNNKKQEMLTLKRRAKEPFKDFLIPQQIQVLDHTPLEN